MTDKRIGVFMGGESAEREISIKSGTAIYQALKSLGYHVVSIDVGHDICRVLEKESIETAFLALHGGYGENGSIQGMLEVLGIPYTGSGVLSSALAMDKEASKKIFRYHDIPVPPYTIIPFQSTDMPTLSAINFTLPWVVKPVAEGSSVGVSIIRDEEDVWLACEKALTYGPKIIIEQYIEGKEVHIGILNGKVLGGVEVRPSLEFYNYEAKYTAGLTDYILPPDIDQSAYERSKEVALAAHTALGCQGATRVDLRVGTKGNPYVLEVNTIPGMTETSLLPKIAGLVGLSFPSLLEEILRGVIEKEQ
jgi:D-alanine-D-alanine ligase